MSSSVYCSISDPIFLFLYQNVNLTKRNIWIPKFCMCLFEFCLVFVLGASYANDRMTVAAVHHSALTDSSLAERPIILLPVAANLWIDPQTNTNTRKIHTNTRQNLNKYKAKFKQIQGKIQLKTCKTFSSCWPNQYISFEKGSEKYKELVSLSDGMQI